MKWRTIDTKKGIRCRVFEGGSGTPLVYFHGAGGLLKENPFVQGVLVDDEHALVGLHDEVGVV